MGVWQLEAAAKALWRLAEEDENIEPIMWSGGLLQLLQLLSPNRLAVPPSEIACEAAIRALTCLARSDEAAGSVIRGGEPARGRLTERSPRATAPGHHLPTAISLCPPSPEVYRTLGRVAPESFRPVRRRVSVTTRPTDSTTGACRY